MEWLRAMKIFASVVKGGSLSSAGREFGLSPASISRQMSALEEHLGARLLNRTSRQLTLTEAGELYYGKVEQILGLVADANDGVASLQGTARGVLRVHSRMLVGHVVLVPALPRFLARFPDVQIDLRLSNHAVDLVAQNIDVDIRIGKLADSSLIARKLMPSRRVICAAPDYLARSAPVERPADLALHNCLTYRINIGQTVWRFLDHNGVLTEVPVTGNIQSDNGKALLDGTRAGVGIALMPDWSVEHDIAAGRLVELFPEYTASHIEFENGVYAIYQSSRHVSAKLRVFVEFLAETFRQHRLPAAREEARPPGRAEPRPLPRGVERV
jgi:DNA-binding transcriptional LysR family regulator